MIAATLLLLHVMKVPNATRFRVVEEHGVAWFVRQNGDRFVSRGVCCIGQGDTAKTYDPKNPGYAAYRYYLSSAEWASDTLDRLSSWGFNTVGAWSDTAALRVPNRPDMVFTPILHMGSAAGAPWKDMWDPKVVDLMDSIAKSQIRPLKRESRILGYFSDNEMGWWYGAMFDWAFRAGVHSRSHLVALLRERYHDSWSAALRDFEPSGASSFEDLKAKGRLFLRPGADGLATVQAWMRLVSDRYYSLCRGIIKKYDPGALYLGDRYISNFYPEVAESAGRYCDVVSTNLNADTADGTFAPFYLPSLRQITKRPILITEYYQAASENRSGNQNDSSGFPVAPTQRGRAVAFSRQTRTLLQTPYVVGAHWFQYFDEPMHGRGDGEDYDMGLVDIFNRPYEQLVQASRALDAESVHDKSLTPRKTGSDPTVGRVPYFSDQSIKLVELFLNRALLVAPSSFNSRGDLYLARNRGRVYACVYWNEDLFPEAFYKTGKVPAADYPQFELQVSGKKLTAVVPSAGAPTVSGGSVVAYKYGVRNYVIFELPPVDPGLHVLAKMTTRGRAYRMAWSGKYSD
jgi:hypothetical protein